MKQAVLGFLAGAAVVAALGWSVRGEAVVPAIPIETANYAITGGSVVAGESTYSTFVRMNTSTGESEMIIWPDRLDAPTWVPISQFLEAK